jgi:hypothetical protein
MAGNIYLAQLQNQVVAGSASMLLLLRPPTTRPIRIVRYKLDYNGTATSTQIRYQFGRKASAFPTGMASITPAALNATAPTAQVTGGTSGAAGTCGGYVTSEGAGAFVATIDGAFNALNGLDEFFGEFSDLYLPPGSAEGFALRFPVSPVLLTAWTASIYFKED